MNKFGSLIAKDTVQFQRILPGSIEKVWSYLVEPDKRAKWLADGETELKMGGVVELHFNNGSLSELEDVPSADKYKDMPDCVSFSGRVTQCDPPVKLSYTWAGENELSEVTYELCEQDGKVLLTLTHKKLDSADLLLGVAAGWHTHLEILEAILTEQVPQPFWLLHNNYEVEYAKKFKL